MNRKISSAILGIAFLGATAFALHANNSAKTVSDLELANIEALSNYMGENTTYRMPCCKNRIYTGSYSNMTLKCSTCSYKLGYSGHTDGSCP